ncbi:MAG: lecithin retinol acyltransferase family protein [Bacillota bacterium]|nr:lecithin retinol acyltransferase family protein [Bacillota bacterium]
MLKKDYFKGLISGALLASLLTGAVFAQNIEKTVTAAYKNIQIFVNGSEIKPTDANGNSVEPFIVNGTIYLPVRAVGKAFDKSVKWDANENTAYLDEVPEKVKKAPEVGDVIGDPRSYKGINYEHYGIYIGDNKVIHYMTPNNSGKASDAEVAETTMDGHFDKDKMFVLKFDKEKVFNPEETVKRAKSMLGEKKYNLVTDNCEHFALWCKIGVRKSYQVDSLTPDQLSLLKSLSELIGSGMGI